MLTWSICSLPRIQLQLSVQWLAVRGNRTRRTAALLALLMLLLVLASRLLEPVHDSPAGMHCPRKLSIPNDLDKAPLLMSHTGGAKGLTITLRCGARLEQQNLRCRESPLDGPRSTKTCYSSSL